jgi:hypothetical protein
LPGGIEAVVSPVGRTGAEGASVVVLVVEEDSVPGQLAPVAHWRPDWQQPPPRLAGQEKNPDVQVAEVEVVAVVVAVGDGVVVVGTTMTPVEVVGLAVVEVEGCTYVTDVPATTPITSQLL